MVAKNLSIKKDDYFLNNLLRISVQLLNSNYHRHFRVSLHKYTVTKLEKPFLHRKLLIELKAWLSIIRLQHYGLK